MSEERASPGSNENSRPSGLPDPRGGRQRRWSSLKPARPLIVLLCEDNAVNQRLTRHILEKWGHKVVLATNGKEALAALQIVRHEETGCPSVWIPPPFDVVLMDVEMPEMDGWEATEHIRAHELQGETRLPIVALTACAQKGDGERCRAAGMDAYVTKPIEAGALFEILEGLMASASTRSRSAEADALVSIALEGAAILNRLEDDPQTMQRIVEMLLRNWPAFLARVEDAIARRDAVELQRAAHALQGSASNIYATGVVQAAFRLEILGREKDLDAAQQLFADLEAEVQCLLAALRESNPHGK